MNPNKENKGAIFISVGLFSLVVVLMMLPSYELLVKPRGQAFDWFWIWAGGRAVLTGQNPYGSETTRIIQLGVFRKIIPSMFMYWDTRRFPVHLRA